LIETRRKIPLSLQVLLGVGLGMAAGVAFGTGPIALGLTTEKLGTLGLLVIRLLKALAAPLIFFAIVDGFLKTRIRGRDGRLLVGICLFNVTVAFGIGLFLINTLRPGDLWRGHVDEMLGLVAKDGSPNPLAAASAARPSLDPWKNVTGYVPESLLEPFRRTTSSASCSRAPCSASRCATCPTSETGRWRWPRTLGRDHSTGILWPRWKIVAFVPFAVFCLSRRWSAARAQGLQVSGCSGRAPRRAPAALPRLLHARGLARGRKRRGSS
jgi:hypothetical protein